MIDRLSVFSNREVQKLLREKFIPVACNDWYQRRRQDDEGEFFRKVANQGPRKGAGGATRQGHYVFTASGKLLGYNNNRDVSRRLKMIRQALEKWETLPAEHSSPRVAPPVRVDTKFQRALPGGASVVKVYTRAMELRDGRLRRLNGMKHGHLAAIDHLWLRREEVVQLGEIMKQGGGEFPDRLKRRIVRFHLLDSTRGEPPFWRGKELKVLKLKLAKDGKIEGSFSMNTSDNQRGYEGKISGQLTIGKQGGLEKFELLAVGNHWGGGPYTKNPRPGKTPLCIAMNLVKQPSAADLIPPQGMHWEAGYWKAEQE